MSWIDSLLGTDSENENQDNSNNSTNSNNSNNDKNIAMDMLISSKMDITSLAKTITETTNPQLRQILSAQLTNSVNQHFRLSDMAINKQWYNAYANPQDQIKQDIKEVQSLSQNSNQNQQCNQEKQNQQDQQNQQN